MKLNQKRIVLNTITAILTLFAVLFFLCFVVNFTFDLTHVKTYVRGYSMQPTLNGTIDSSDMSRVKENWDIVYTNEWAKIYVDDIIVANVTWNGQNKNVVKRLIGKAGDIIEIKEEDECYALYSSSRLIYKKNKYKMVELETGETAKVLDTGVKAYISDYNRVLRAQHQKELLLPENEKTVLEQNGTLIYRVPENGLFVMGDNWAVSDDSTNHLAIDANSVVGKCMLITHKEDNHFFNYVGYVLKLLFTA